MKNIARRTNAEKKFSSRLCAVFFVALLTLSVDTSAHAYTFFGSFSDSYVEKELLTDKLNYKHYYSFTDTLDENTIPYDESNSASIYDQTKQADNALVQAILRHNIPLEEIIIEDSYLRNQNKTIFLFQKINIILPEKISPESFNNILKENLSLWAEGATIEYNKEKKKSSIYIEKHLTHEISYNKNQNSAKLSIVIDDLGGSTKDALDLISLNYPVSFSILPDTTHATLTAELAHFSNREVYLHQPMIALKGRFVVSETFLITDDKETLKKKLSNNLNIVPYATALNNHTGSAFTQNTDAVLRYLDVQKEVNPDMHILDSRTIADSKLFIEAQNAGFVTKQREVFIDNIQNQQEIEKQLNKAMRIAQQTNSHIIVIGHPYKETIRALKNWKGYQEIEVVRSF